MSLSRDLQYCARDVWTFTSRRPRGFPQMVGHQKPWVSSGLKLRREQPAGWSGIDIQYVIGPSLPFWMPFTLLARCREYKVTNARLSPWIAKAER